MINRTFSITISFPGGIPRRFSGTYRRHRIQILWWRKQLETREEEFRQDSAVRLAVFVPRSFRLRGPVQWNRSKIPIRANRPAILTLVISKNHPLPTRSSCLGTSASTPITRIGTQFGAFSLARFQNVGKAIFAPGREQNDYAWSGIVRRHSIHRRRSNGCLLAGRR